MMGVGVGVEGRFGGWGRRDEYAPIDGRSMCMCMGSFPDCLVRDWVGCKSL